MESPGDKNWASSYLLDPLSGPQPSEETGPGTHFIPQTSISISNPVSPPSSAKKLSKNSFRQSSSPKSTYTSTTEVTGKSRRGSYPSPPQSASPRQDRFPTSPTKGGRSRGSSLGERFAGDTSHRPLEQIKKDAKSANRAPHLRKSHQIPPDTVDSLSTVGGGPYHHEGPYDAALFARNRSNKTAPLNALDHSNREALKATPPEKVIDSIRGHRPLDGVASYAPGEADRNGHIYAYEQGDNMMISGNPEGGAYKRWPGVKYDPDDVKGKGEPSYTLEKALKGEGGDLKGHRKTLSGGDIEMTPRPKYPGDSLSNAAGNDPMWGDGEESALRRRAGSLKKKLGSLRKHRQRGD